MLSDLLSGTTREPRQIAAIQQGLAEPGFVDGKNVTIEYRWAEGNFDRLPKFAAELVQRQVAVILGMQSATAPLAAKAATATIPIVFSIGGDPVKLPLVASLAKPGGNVTGSTFLVNSLGAKRMDLLRELPPVTGVVGVLMNPKNPSVPGELKDLQTAAQALGRKLHVQNASRASEIDAAFASFVRERVSALTFAADAVFNSRRSQIIGLAGRHRLPTMYFIRDFADDWRAHELRRQFRRRLPASGRLCGTHSERRAAGKSAGSAIDEGRVRR